MNTHSDKLSSAANGLGQESMALLGRCMWQQADCPAGALTLAREPETRTDETGSASNSRLLHMRDK